MVEGESGIFAVAPDWARPIYEPTKRRMTWPNGAIATLYSADEPERLRGPQHDAAACDELGSWRHPAAWDMLMFGLRIGRHPRVVVATTPRPTRLIKGLLACEGKDVVVTRGNTYENRANLAPIFLDQIIRRYEGTRLGRQELDAEVLDDTPGALWTRDQLEQCRVERAPELKRIVVAIDPAAKSGEDADETGIIVAGVDGAGHGYVLDDLSGHYAPAEWARKAIGAYQTQQADRIVAEINNGGEMVEQVLRGVDTAVSFRAVHASRGKVTRAEPVAALFEQNKVHLVGCFPELEDQLCAFTSDFDRARAGYSPDRLDAMVWALTDLMVEPMPSFGIWQLYKEDYEALQARQAAAPQTASV
jgi:predicted phage terminase large subunit-like protein